MVTISTAGSDPDGVLGRLRARALAQPAVTRTGPLTRAHGPALAMLEWSVADDWDGDRPRARPRREPGELDHARGPRRAARGRRRHRVPPLPLQPVGGVRPALAADRRVARVRRPDGEDPAGRAHLRRRRCRRRAQRSAPSPGSPRTCASTARCSPATRRSSSARRRCASSPRTSTSPRSSPTPGASSRRMLELAERGIRVTEFPQSNARMGPASERLHAAIVEGRLSHPDDPALNAHVRQAIARDTPRGWRIDKAQVPRQHRRRRRAGDGGRGRGEQAGAPWSCSDGSETLPRRLRRPHQRGLLLQALPAPQRVTPGSGATFASRSSPATATPASTCGAPAQPRRPHPPRRTRRHRPRGEPSRRVPAVQSSKGRQP